MNALQGWWWGGDLQSLHEHCLPLMHNIYVPVQLIDLHMTTTAVLLRLVQSGSEFAHSLCSAECQQDLVRTLCFSTLDLTAI